MSFAEALVPFLPSMFKTGASIYGGIQTQKSEEVSAARSRSIAESEGRLREIQATRLLGQIQASFGGRGVAGGVTDVDLESGEAFLEGMDVARARFRYESLAQQADARGKAALASGIIGAVGGLADMATISHTKSKADRAKAAAAAAKKVAGPTVLKASAKGTQFGPFSAAAAPQVFGPGYKKGRK